MNKDKVINELLSRIAKLEYEVERLENKIQKAIEILENKKHCERLFGGVEEKSFTEQALDILDKVDKGGNSDELR